MGALAVDHNEININYQPERNEIADQFDQMDEKKRVGQGLDFEKKTSCQKFVIIIKWIGATVSLLNVSADILYAYKAPYG